MFFRSFNRLKGTTAVTIILLLSLLVLLILSVKDFTATSDEPVIEFVSFDPEEKLILYNDNRDLQIGKALEYLPDPENRLELEDILAPDRNSRFVPLWEERKTSKYFSYYDGVNEDMKAIWVRMNVEKIYGSEPVLLTTPFNSTIVSVYIAEESQNYRFTYHRIETPWRLFSNDPEIFIQLPGNMDISSPVYIKMETRFKRRLKLDFTAMKFADYTNESSLRFHSQGLFIGFFLAILVFHIILYIITQEEKYYYYILFMFFLMINRMLTTQISLWKYWAGMFYLENLIYSLVLAGLQISGLHFIRKTLVNRYDTRKISHLNRITNYLYVIYLIWAVLSGLIHLPHIYNQVIITIMVGINMIMVYQYISFALAKGNKSAKLYIIAFSPFFLFEILFTLAYPVYSFIQNFIPCLSIRYITDFIQCTVLAAAVGQDIVRYKTQKEISDQILRDRLENENRYLEHEVEERTKELQKAMTLAEFANSAKSRFLANISHELRTPLGGIIGFAELINKTEDPLLQKKYNQKILAESGHLLNLISDVLNLSRIESGNYEIESFPFVLTDTIQDSLAGQQVLIREKGLNYDLIMHKNLPDVVIGDPHRLRQVLLNLTNNAQKFTNKGGVKIVIGPVTSPIENTILIGFEIQDTGVGISASKAEMIFKPFYQVDHSNSRSHDGTGLGTTISKKLVELMGGEIGYTPNTPRGSIFWFNLPFEISSREMLPDNEPQSLIHGSGEILIVDDYQTNREITSTHLQSLGYTTSLAEDGYKAVSLCSQKKFDLILMDIHMPMLNGFDTVEKIEAKCPRNDTTPVLMLTAGGFEHEAKGRIEGNIRGIIYKPVQLNAISYQVAAILNPDSLEDAGEKPESSRTYRLEDFLGQFEKRQDGIDIFLGFLENCRKDLKSLNEDLRSEDFSSLHRKVHAIKGGALNLGLPELADTALYIEHFIKRKDFFTGGISDYDAHIIGDYIQKLSAGISEIERRYLTTIRG